MRRFVLPALLSFFLLLIVRTALTAPYPPGSDKNESDIENEVRQAVLQQVSVNRNQVIAFQLFDISVHPIRISEDGDWAVAWMNFIDPQSGVVIPTEPGLAIAQKIGDTWTAVVPGDPRWSQELFLVPEELLPPLIKEDLALTVNQTCDTSELGPFTGYLLPWAGGTSKILTRSITHTLPPGENPSQSMLYAFDFAAPHDSSGTSPFFNLYAAKDGVVKFAVWSNPNFNEDSANYLVLEDTSTDPVSYHLYLHMAQDSIPEELRESGAQVRQGQFIGVADDTGYSTGSHLHFQVHTNPSSYWGCSVDVLFDDVNINGGRPRTTIEASNYPSFGNQGQWEYFSGNPILDDITAPVGDLFAPQIGDVVLTSTVLLDGWAFDEDSGLEQAQFYANFNKTWQAVGSVFTTTTFAYAWDMCSDYVPDGPISVGVRLEDKEGNINQVTGIKQFVKDHTCTPPPPDCIPTDDQIALFTEADFRGECVILDVGTHLVNIGRSEPAFVTGLVDRSSLKQMLAEDYLMDELRTAEVHSILVGEQVLGSLYREIPFRGRSQTFSSDDSNLADNRIGTDGIALVHVQPITQTPGVPIPAWPPSGSVYTGTPSLSLMWDDGGGSLDFQAQIAGPTGTVTSTWLSNSVWHLGSLDPGTYAWEVRGRNMGGVSAWFSPAVTLTVQPELTPTIPVTVTAPFSDDMESGTSGWSATGLWNLLNDSSNSHSPGHAWWYGTPEGNYLAGSYQTGDANVGDLTSPPVFIPSENYALRFWYRYNTESDSSNWDQRWVQISADGGPFTNVLQLSDDPVDWWLQSPPIDLTNYLSQTVRFRFHFETLDARNNGFPGWLIDDVTVLTETLPTCYDPNEPNDNFSDAISLPLTGTISAEICPAGDVDFYSVTGFAGDRLGVDIDSISVGSSLDPYLFVLDSDGESVLAENDDEILYVSPDSLLHFTLPRDGTYYLKIRAWNHPSAGGADHPYTMTLSTDQVDPLIHSFSPVSDPGITTYLPLTVPLTVSTTDDNSGISFVEFLWHSGDWVNGNWELIGTDDDSSDGWGLVWDISNDFLYPEQLEVAIFIRIYDKAGNTTGVGIWNLGIDRTPPDTSAIPLPATQESTAVLLQWSATDTAPIRRYDLNFRKGNTAWQDLADNLEPSITQKWFVGEVSNNPVNYSFRIRAVDEAGNIEKYIDGAEVSTTILPCTAPDVWEGNGGDNSFVAASVITNTQTHNFCEAHDEDWVQFYAIEGQTYRIEINPLHVSSAAEVELYVTDTITASSEITLSLVAQASPIIDLGDGDVVEVFGQPTVLVWKPQESSLAYVRLRHPEEGVAGNSVEYEVFISQHYLYAPIIFR